MADESVDESMAVAVYDQDAARPPMLQWSDEDLAALRDTVAKGCNPAQFKVFLVACRRLGLDPFARQIVPIVQGVNMTPQVTIDGFRLISERTGKYGGMLGPYWCGPDGEWRDVWLADGAPVAAKVGIIRRDFDQPVWGVARYKSYAKGGTWNQMPDLMIAKVAESIARRIAFPQELSGAYTDAEMDQADVTPPGTVDASPPARPREAPRPAPKPATPAGEESPTADQLDEIQVLCEALGVPAPTSPKTRRAADNILRGLEVRYQRERQAQEDAAARVPADALEHLPAGAGSH